MKTAIYGSLAYDYVLRTDENVTDMISSNDPKDLAKIPLVSAKRFFGGNGGNMAYGMALLGSKPDLHSALGNDGSDYLDRLSSMNLDTQNIVCHPDIPSTTIYFLVDSCRREIALFIAEASRRREFNPLTIKKDIDLVHVCGLPKLSRDVIEYAHNKNLQSIFDPGQGIDSFSSEDLDFCIRHSTFTMLNAQEYTYAIKSGVHDALLQTFQVLTKGQEGVTLCPLGEREEVIPICPLAAPPVQTLGAGDAFRAGFLHAISKDMDPTKATMLGCAMASLTLESGQAQMPQMDRGALQEHLRKAYKISLPA